MEVGVGGLAAGFHQVSYPTRSLPAGWLCLASPEEADSGQQHPPGSAYAQVTAVFAREQAVPDSAVENKSPQKIVKSGGGTGTHSSRA